MPIIVLNMSSDPSGTSYTVFNNLYKAIGINREKSLDCYVCSLMSKDTDRRRHICGKSIYETWPASLEIIWAIAVQTIARFQREHQLTTHAFVLMSNHYHWLCSVNEENEVELFRKFQNELTSAFPTQFEDAFIEDLSEYIAYKNTYRYVYRNPVTAGLVCNAEDYPYSTLRSVLGRERLPFHCIDNMNLIVNPLTVLNWINQVHVLL